MEAYFQKCIVVPALCVLERSVHRTTIQSKLCKEVVNSVQSRMCVGAINGAHLTSFRNIWTSLLEPDVTNPKEKQNQFVAVRNLYCVVVSCPWGSVPVTHGQPLSPLPQYFLVGKENPLFMRQLR
uniref:Mediator of RNA polymerase II transcription subunit 13 n=1 Tax=Steinernema glaseri TaxID=37863 RepID=A0A1I8A894_9BILA